MVARPFFSLFQLVCLCHIVDSLASPFGNVTSAPSLSSFNGSSVPDDRHSFIIPHTQLTLHLTILSPQTPLPGANTLKCLHTFAQSILTDPPTKSFEHIRTQAIKDVKVMLAPAHCPVCGFTNRDACKVLAGLWYFISREKLLYAQRYGVFEGRTGRMVAWGTLLTGSMATDVLGDMDVDPAVPLGLAEIS